MNILILVSQLPYSPDTGAKIRTFNLVKELSSKHNITLVAYGQKKNDRKKIQALVGYCNEIVLVPRSSILAGIKMVLSLFSRLPYGVKKYYSRKMEKVLKRLLANKEIDLIHCDSLQMTLNIRNVKDVPRLLTEHNIESEIVRRLVETEKNVFKKAFFKSQYAKLKRYEIKVCRSFPAVVTVSEKDMEYLSKFIDPMKIRVIPNGVDLKYFGLTPSDKDVQVLNEEQSIVFTGSMDWLPNEDAVINFCEKILPLIRKNAPHVTFTVAGRDPSSKLRELAAHDKGVTITGRVEDVRPYVNRSCVFVVPLRIGGGTRLKILEAMAMGKPVVSTQVGAEGLDVKDRENILIADSDQEFARAVIELLKNKALRERLGRAGRKLAEKKYDWEQIALRLDKIWTDAAGFHELPILLYHDIASDDFDISSVDPGRIPYILNESEFERQMKYLYSGGYKTIGLDEFPALKDYDKQDKLVAIVFDDGLISNYEKAFPILNRYDQKATFFITAGQVGEMGMMDWPQIIDLKKRGMLIGSHSMSHSVPLNLNEKEMEYELEESKRLLEKRLDSKVDYFSSPTGYLNPRLAVTAKMCGYRKVLVSNPRLNKPDDAFILNKTSIKRGYRLDKFIAIVERKASVLKGMAFQHDVRSTLKSLIGYKGYELLRSGILGGAR